MVLQNYVILVPGKPSRMHFTDHEVVVKTITDPVSGRPKPINALVFTVDTLEGRPVVAYYSTVSQKHAQDFAPYLPDKKYTHYDFIILMMGEGFRREYQVQVIPHPA